MTGSIKATNIHTTHTDTQPYTAVHENTRTATYHLKDEKQREVDREKERGNQMRG